MPFGTIAVKGLTLVLEMPSLVFFKSLVFAAILSHVSVMWGYMAMIKLISTVC